MKDKFDFHMPVHICMGAGISRRVADYIKGENILVISDPFLYQNGTAQKTGESMTGKKVSYFSGIEQNPSCECVDAAAAQAREIQADCIVGIGGGSALDVSKAVACLTGSGGSIYDYYSGGTEKFKKRQTMLVLVPTTAGTGSEVTNVGVFTDHRKNVKMPMVNHEFWADYALLDPELTYSLPPAVTASTGMDAFCHAIEAYWNRESQPVCDFLGMGAMKLILENIKTAYDHPDNATARTNMLLASLIAGIAFSQTRTTGIHACSFPLTTEFGASHGTACAITLPAFIRTVKAMAGEKMWTLCAYLGCKDTDALAETVEKLMTDMHMPVRLRELGVRREDITHISKTALTAAIIQLTPAEMNQGTVETLLQSIY